MCIWEKAQNLWNEQNYKVPECCFPGGPSGKYGFGEENIPPLELRAAVMEGEAGTYFTQEVRTIAPF